MSWTSPRLRCVKPPICQNKGWQNMFLHQAAECAPSCPIYPFFGATLKSLEIVLRSPWKYLLVWRLQMLKHQGTLKRYPVVSHIQMFLHGLEPQTSSERACLLRDMSFRDMLCRVLQHNIWQIFTATYERPFVFTTVASHSFGKLFFFFFN